MTDKSMLEEELEELDKEDLWELYKIARDRNYKLKESIEAYLQGASLEVLYDAIGQPGDVPTVPHPIKAKALLEELHGLQNGCPLEKYRQEWETVMKETKEFLYG